MNPKYRFDNLEFRWVESFGEGKTQYPEIICWVMKGDGSEFCYTLAYWVEDAEGWNLKFVGDRPFYEDNIDAKLFWELAKMGNTIANAEWRTNRFMRER